MPGKSRNTTLGSDSYIGMNITHISTNYAAFESARSGFFVFQIDSDQLTNLLLPTSTAVTDTATYNAQNISDALRLSVTKCSVPHYKVDTASYRRGNDVVNFATTPSFDDGSLTVDDYIGLDTKSILMSWLRLAYDPFTRKGGRMSAYKKTCKLMEYTQDYELIRTWTLEGCFITELSEEAFDKENDGKRQISATFKYDRAVPEVPTAA